MDGGLTQLIGNGTAAHLAESRALNGAGSWLASRLDEQWPHQPGG